MSLAAVAAILAAPQMATARDTDGSDTPDPFILHGQSRYFAFSTNSTVNQCGVGMRFMNVPHRSIPRLSDFGRPASCFADSLPNPGAWAKNPKARQGGVVWSPTVWGNHDNGTFVMLYTAERVGNTVQKCIGRATSATAGGPYTPDSSPWRCPSGGYWAIDPNAYTNSLGAYIQWREDRCCEGAHAEKRIIGAKFSFSGRTQLTSGREYYSSKNVSWDGEWGIENPAIHYSGGTWLLYFSGHNFASDTYATGIANCGSTLSTGGRCTAYGPTNRPWFGWSGRSPPPVVTIPGNRKGPGGLSFVSKSTGGFVTDSGGSPYVAMHVWEQFYTRWRPMILFRLVYVPGALLANF